MQEKALKAMVSAYYRHLRRVQVSDTQRRVAVSSACSKQSHGLFLCLVLGSDDCTMASGHHRI